MGTLNIASWGLAVGTIGQCVLYGRLPPGLPQWIMMSVLSPPWLLVFVISFCNRPPFGPRSFRRCFLLAMCWYALFTILSEALHFIFHPAPPWHFAFIVARVLMYGGLLGFIPLLRACVLLRRLESNQPAEPGASPSGGPATPSGDSEVKERPPSVS